MARTDHLRNHAWMRAPLSSGPALRAGVARGLIADQQPVDHVVDAGHLAGQAADICVVRDFEDAFEADAVVDAANHQRRELQSRLVDQHPSNIPFDLALIAGRRTFPIDVGRSRRGNRIIECG
ncbi:MAG: hypothetical protein ACF8PG_15545 [Maioricimonas sp. JB045]